MKVTKQLSLVIVTFKSNDVVDNCLASIQKYNDIGDALEVIVVDNHPIGGEAFATLAPKFPWVRTICNPANGGFGQGNNLGARIAGGSYILFLNPDTILVEPIFNYAIRQFALDSSLVMFGMLLYGVDGKICNNSFGIMPERKRLLPSMIWLPLIKYCGVTPKHLFPLGADLFVRKDSFDRAGRFDEGMFLCYEEPDLVRRLPTGSRVKIFNKKIIHLEGHTTESEGIERRINWALDSERYYFRKHGLDYRKFSAYALASLRFKTLAKRLFGRIPSRTETLLLDHYQASRCG